MNTAQAMKNRFQQILPIVVLLWITVVISFYFIYHKPITLPLALSLGRAGWNILIALGLISAGGGLGALIYQDDALHPLTRLAIQAALGLGVLGISFLLVGSTLGVNPYLFGSILVLLLSVFWRLILSWWGAWRTLIPLWRETDCFGRWLAYGIVLILLAALSVALAPPLKFDSLVYHLTLPHQYINAGRVIYIPELMFWGMPQLNEMLFTWVMVLSNAQAATVFGWMIGVLVLLGMLGFAGQYLGTKFAWLSLAALLAGFTTSASLAWGYVEWMMMFFGFAFLVTMVRWAEDGLNRDLLLTGVFCGLSLGIKYTAGVLSLVGIGIIIWQCRQFPWHEIFKKILYFSLPVILVSLPWWVKNVMATGNPFYPYFFPAGDMNLLRLSIQQGLPTWGNWQDFLLLPIKATLTGREGAPGYGASIGPLMLALGVMARLGWQSHSNSLRKVIKISSFIALFGLSIWAMLGRLSGLLIQTRLYYSFFPALAILAGAGFKGIAQIKIPNVRLSRLAGSLILLVLCLNACQYQTYVFKLGAPQTIFSLQSERDYQIANLGWFTLVMETIEDLPDDALVMMLWESRSFYCVPKCVADETQDLWITEYDHYQDIEFMRAAWLDQGFSHILISNLGIEFYKNDPTYFEMDWGALNEFIAPLNLHTDFDKVYQLYELAP